MFRALALRLSNSSRWPIYVINSVDNTKLPCNFVKACIVYDYSMSPARNHCSYSCNLSVTGALKAGRVIKVALINSFQTNLREFSHSPLCLKEVMFF